MVESQTFTDELDKARKCGNHFVVVAECYLASEDTVQAENYVKKAGQYMGEIEIALKKAYVVTDQQIMLRFKKTKAGTCFDVLWPHGGSRTVNCVSLALSQTLTTRTANFLTRPASTMSSPRPRPRSSRPMTFLSCWARCGGPPTTPTSYNTLIYSTPSKAVTCSILGKAGPQRDRILGSLSKDERLGTLDSVDGYSQHAQILKKMHSQHILRRSDMQVSLYSVVH